MFTANEDGKGHKNITEPSVTFTVTQSKSSLPPPSPPPSPLPPYLKQTRELRHLIYNMGDSISYHFI